MQRGKLVTGIPPIPLISCSRTKRSRRSAIRAFDRDGVVAGPEEVASLIGEKVSRRSIRIKAPLPLVRSEK